MKPLEVMGTLTAVAFPALGAIWYVGTHFTDLDGRVHRLEDRVHTLEDRVQTLTVSPNPVAQRCSDLARLRADTDATDMFAQPSLESIRSAMAALNCSGLKK